MKGKKVIDVWKQKPYYLGMASSKAVKFGPVFARASYTVKVRGEHGCAVYGNSDVSAQVECYLSTRPHGVVDVFYSESCGHCSGSGRVCTNRRMMRWAPCPACKGNPEIQADTLIATF